MSFQLPCEEAPTHASEISLGVDPQIIQRKRLCWLASSSLLSARTTTTKRMKKTRKKKRKKMTIGGDEEDREMIERSRTIDRGSWGKKPRGYLFLIGRRSTNLITGRRNC